MPRVHHQSPIYKEAIATEEALARMEDFADDDFEFDDDGEMPTNGLPETRADVIHSAYNTVCPSLCQWAETLLAGSDARAVSYDQVVRIVFENGGTVGHSVLLYAVMKGEPLLMSNGAAMIVDGIMRRLRVLEWAIASELNIVSDNDDDGHDDSGIVALAKKMSLQRTIEAMMAYVDRERMKDYQRQFEERMRAMIRIDECTARPFGSASVWTVAYAVSPILRKLTTDLAREAWESKLQANKCVVVRATPSDSTAASDIEVVWGRWQPEKDDARRHYIANVRKTTKIAVERVVEAVLPKLVTYYGDWLMFCWGITREDLEEADVTAGINGKLTLAQAKVEYATLMAMFIKHMVLVVLMCTEPKSSTTYAFAEPNGLYYYVRTLVHLIVQIDKTKTGFTRKAASVVTYDNLAFDNGAIASLRVVMTYAMRCSLLTQMRAAVREFAPPQSRARLLMEGVNAHEDDPQVALDAFPWEEVRDELRKRRPTFTINGFGPPYHLQKTEKGKARVQIMCDGDGMKSKLRDDTTEISSKATRSLTLFKGERAPAAKRKRATTKQDVDIEEWTL